MASTEDDSPSEETALLPPSLHQKAFGRLLEDETSSIVQTHVTKDEQALAGSAVGERLPYNDYTTIDWMHDLVKDSYRYRLIHGGKGIRKRAYALFDSSAGWIAVALCGTLTACVAYCVDVAEATVSDWKQGYCKGNPLLDRARCCKNEPPIMSANGIVRMDCPEFQMWSENYWKTFGIYVGFALAYGIVSASITMFTKAALPIASPGYGDTQQKQGRKEKPVPKSIYLAAGSGIPEIKTHLSGFVIPHFLSFKVLIIKAVGAVFAVASGMCLGKEGPFVHISACVGNLVGSMFSRYRDNGRKLRELLAAAIAAGMAVAFGAPVGGVLFAYEEISTYFPRKVLWRAFLCSAFAAMVLKALNPTGTGKLVLFETHYGTKFPASDYIVFTLLGIAGGLWGGMFCKLNFIWSKWFRSDTIIKNYPVLEVFLVVLVTGLLQFPNPLVREPGDKVIKNLLVDCRKSSKETSWVCMNEARTDGKWDYIGWLVYGCAVKLVLTIVTFGAKVPSGIIIPAMDAGCLFGRLIGQWIGGASPGIFAMVGAGAFLAGVSRMTISLCVILFELTGEVDYIVPHMIAILVAKWVADSLSSEGVYDLAQTVLGHPFLDSEHSMRLVQSQSPPHLISKLMPPPQTMAEITVKVDSDNKVPRQLLEKKLNQLKDRGLMDAGLVLVQNDILQGYFAEGELDFGLTELGRLYPEDVRVRLLGEHIEGFTRGDDSFDVETTDFGDEPHPALNKSEYLDLSGFIDRTPMSLCESAPMEYAIECFSKLGLRHLMVTEEGTGKLKGVIIKKRLLAYLEGLH